MEATVSQSLRLLRASQDVAARREGRLVYYRLADAGRPLGLNFTKATYPASAARVACVAAMARSP